MKKFIIGVLLFLAPLLILDRIWFNVLSHFRPSDYKEFLDAKQSFFKGKSQYDILIIGDSHIADAVDPNLIEEKTGYTGFNLGVYHSTPFENYYIAKNALKNLQKPPKYIILGTNPVMFKRGTSVGRYTPIIINDKMGLIMNSDEGIDAQVFFPSIREKYLINSIIGKLRGKEYKPTRVIEKSKNGFLTFFNQKPLVQWKSSNTEEIVGKEINESQLEYFIKTIQIAKAQNIQIYIVHTPIWREQLNTLNQTDHFKTFVSTIDSIAQEYQVKVIYKYINNDANDSYNQSEYLDPQPLNYNGAKKFTQYLITEIFN